MYVYCSVSLCQKYFTVLNVLHNIHVWWGKGAKWQVSPWFLMWRSLHPLPFSVRFKFGVQPNLAKTTTAGGQDEYDGQQSEAVLDQGNSQANSIVTFANNSPVKNSVQVSGPDNVTENVAPLCVIL